MPDMGTQMAKESVCSYGVDGVEMFFCFFGGCRILSITKN